MAIRNKNSVNEILRNSIGGVTYCYLNGQSLLKSKVFQNTSKTPLQQRQRARWPEYANLANAFWDGLEIGFPGRPRKQSPFNAFVRANKDTVSVSEQLEVTVDYEKVVCAQGRVTTPTVSATVDKENRSLLVTLQSLSFYSRRSLGSDKVYVQVVEKARQEGFLTELGTREEETPIEITLPTEWDADELVLYVFAATANGRKASKSKFVPITAE